MTKKPYCPINESLNLIGYKWILLIIRDIMFYNKRHFNDFLASNENIAKSILSNRLKKLMDSCIIVKAPDHSHKQKSKYTLNYKGIDLAPIMIELFKWSGYSGSFDDKSLKLHQEINENRIVFEEILKNRLHKELKLVFDLNPEIRLETLRKNRS